MTSKQKAEMKEGAPPYIAQEQGGIRAQPAAQDERHHEALALLPGAEVPPQPGMRLLPLILSEEKPDTGTGAGMAPHRGAASPRHSTAPAGVVE